MNLSDLIASASAETGLPPEFLSAQIQQESSGRPDAVSPAGAIGLMQILPSAHPEYTGGHDPVSNVQYGSRYMRSLLDRFEDPAQAIAAYNAGPGRVRRLVSKYGDNWLQHAPKETRDYVANLLPAYQSAAAQAPATPEVATGGEPVSAIDEMRRRVERRRQAVEDFKSVQKLQAEVAETQAKSPGFFSEAGRAVWGAAVDLTTEATIVAKDAARFILPLDTLLPSLIAGDEVNQEFNYQLRESAGELAPENETLVGGLGRGLLTFVVPYVGWAKAGKAAMTFEAATARGFVIDASLFDPNEGNLSNLIKSLAPDHQNVVLDFLATDPDDDEALNRLRNGLEGVVLGAALEGIFKVARFVRAKKVVDEAHAAADKKATSLDSVKTTVAEDARTAQLLAAEAAARPSPFKPETDLPAVDEVFGNPTYFRDSKNTVAARVEMSPDEYMENAIDGFGTQGHTRADVLGSVNQKKVDEYAEKMRNGETFPALSLDYRNGFSQEGRHRAMAAKQAGVETVPVVVLRAADGPAPKLRQTPRKADPAAALEGKPGAPDGEVLGPPKERDLADTLRETLTLSPEQRAAFNRLLAEGDDDAAAELLQKDFNFDTIDWSKIDNAADIRKILTVTSEVIADHIDNVKGGVQTHEQTRRLANMVGASGEAVHNLFRDVRGDKGIAARFHAAQRTMLASAREVFRLRDIAKAHPGDLAAKAALFRQVELHAALQAEVKGAQTEIARSLNGMALIKAEAEEGFREFEALQRAIGHRARTGKEFERFMDDLLDARSLEELNAKTRMTRGERIRNIFIEYIINSMLSSPKPHVINVLSNTLNAFLYSGDRVLGGAYRRVIHGDKAAWREAKIDILSKITRLNEAFKLARQAWREGVPITDKRQRIEFQTRQAIKMDGDGALAKTVNALGTVVRIPGRALIAGDEFFKAVNRNAEIAVLSYREADRLAEARGLKIGTDAYEKFVADEMAVLMDPGTASPVARRIRSEAIEKSRLGTFQESPKTPGGAALERAINANAFVKLVIAPFFRTPMNILRQGLVDRTPLGFILEETRDAVFRGHPRERAEAISKMTTGVAAMGAFWGLSGTDGKSPIQIIGKVPYDSSEKAAGVLDYSIRIGDQWYQFNRLDPLGMWLGMVADAKMHAEHSDDDETKFALMQGALAGFMNNVTNKTWAKSLSDLYDLAEGAISNKPAAVQRGWAQFAGNQAGKLIPQLAKTVGKTALGGDEHVAREAWTFVDGLNSQLPVLNEQLPPRHDALGRPITWENSALSVVNPFAISPNPTSPVDKELARLDFTVRPMPKNLGGGLVDLNAEEYSKMTGLVGEIRVSRHGNLEETLNAVVTSEDYQGWTEERKVYVIKKYIEAARKAARLTFLSDPEQQKRFKDAKVTELSALISE